MRKSIILSGPSLMQPFLAASPPERWLVDAGLEVRFGQAMVTAMAFRSRPAFGITNRLRSARAPGEASGLGFPPERR